MFLVHQADHCSAGKHQKCTAAHWTSCHNRTEMPLWLGCKRLEMSADF